MSDFEQSENEEDTETFLEKFVICVKSGNLEEFKRLETLQKADFDINWADEFGNTYLSAAAYSGHSNIVAYLLGKNVELDKLTNMGFTALYAAVDQNHADTARLLLEVGADPNCQPYEDKKYAFPLYRAAAGNFIDICEMLLSYGAELGQKFNGATSLQIATQEKHTTVIKMLKAAQIKIWEEKKKEIIANAAKARIEQEKEKKLRCEGLWDKAAAGDLAEFQEMERMQKQEFDINWADEDGKNLV